MFNCIPYCFVVRSHPEFGSGQIGAKFNFCAAPWCQWFWTKVCRPYHWAEFAWIISEHAHSFTVQYGTVRPMLRYVPTPDFVTPQLPQIYLENGVIRVRRGISKWTRNFFFFVFSRNLSWACVGETRYYQTEHWIS